MTMNPVILSVIDVLSDPSVIPHSREADLLCLQLQWIDDEWYETMNETDRGWRVWQRLYWRICKRKTLLPTSLHRRDLSLSTRHRCYAQMNSYGFFTQPDGGSLRCEQIEHYWPNSLVEKATVDDTKSRGVWRDACLVELERIDKEHDRRTAAKRHTYAAHRDTCELLSQRPWLYDELCTLLRKDDNCIPQHSGCGFKIVHKAKADVKDAWRKLVRRETEESEFVNSHSINN
jgi:hypothetical protein